MTARDIKDALRGRHPATNQGIVGEWTCLEEFQNIDLLAISAWSSSGYRRVGYEVKVSRSDYKRELTSPGKRSGAVGWCHEFYFAVPAGLLKDDEIAWREPPWELGHVSPFDRIRCPGAFGAFCSSGRLRFGIVGDRRPYSTFYRADYSRAYDGLCPTCRGVGWIAESPAVRARAPRLWVPSDVGLVVVYETRRTQVVRKAPMRRLSEGAEKIADRTLAQLVRYTSVRPDPRHESLRNSPLLEGAA